MLKSYKGIFPAVDADSLIADSACVIGSVEIKKDVNI